MVRKVKDECKKLEGDSMDGTVLNLERPCTIQDSITESCKEMVLMRQGKKNKHTWEEFMSRVNKDTKKDKD